MKYILLFLVPVAAFAGNRIDDPQACKVVLMAHQITEANSPLTYEKDKGVCEGAQHVCALIHRGLRENCSEVSGFEKSSEASWTAAMAQANAIGTQQGMSSHMAGFCPGYMTNKLEQTQACNQLDADCQQKTWKLSNGQDVVCMNFNVKRSDYINPATDSAPGCNGKCDSSLCAISKEVAGKINAETADRQRMCGEYGAVQGATVGNPNLSNEAQGLNSGTPQDQDSEEPKLVVPAEREFTEEELNQDLQPSPCQNSAFEKVPGCDFPATQPMPEKGLVEKFFDLF